MNAPTTTLACACLALLLTACASSPGPSGALDPDASKPSVAYRCDHGEGFQATFKTDSVVLTGPRGRQELLRDAGGLTPQQTVYSNDEWRAEFGLGASGREAVLQTLKPATVLRCAARGADALVEEIQKK